MSLSGQGVAECRLYRYHEELKVRDARAKGREEGRAEVRYTLDVAEIGVARSGTMDGE